MSFSSWLIDEAALLIKNGMKNEIADEGYQYMGSYEAIQSEWERESAVNTKRRKMPCFFKDGLSYADFEEIAKRAGRKIKRVKNVTISNGVIYCNVESQTGFSNWDFNVDFNDWGHVTGTYWTWKENKDSSIPYYYGQMVSGWIQDYYRERGIRLLDLSKFVDDNKDLETEKGLSYTYKDSFLAQVFGSNSKRIVISYGSENIIGEHLYPVISLLRDSGFKNIKTYSVKDLNDRTPGYCYQVEQVVINGSEFFEAGMSFRENAEVYISYHEKQLIRMPFSQSELKRQNYITVGDKLQELGFTQIYGKKIKDLITGWIINDGSVKSVLIDGDEDKPIKKNILYDYDQKIVICYHTK